jgi:tetratricopeptide (TPR) repeat protein
MPADPAKRLAYFEKITSEGSQDPLAWYGLAMEYKSQGRVDDSVRTFERLRTTNPGYVAMYLMAGGALESAGRTPEAIAWYDAGIEAAKAAGNTHALGELQSARNAAGD